MQMCSPRTLYSTRLRRGNAAVRTLASSLSQIESTLDPLQLRWLAHLLFASRYLIPGLIRGKCLPLSRQYTRFLVSRPVRRAHEARRTYS
jgi:hypothetical protein